DDVTIHEDDVPIEESNDYSNSLFDDDEINSNELESHVESNSVESLSNHDTASDFDNPSVPRPPPEPPNAEFDFELDAGEEILVAIDEFECLDQRDEIDVSTISLGKSIFLISID
nr:hypothetical protein [Tanacetum cinerariifolium]